MAVNMSDPNLIVFLKGAAAVAATQDLTQDVRMPVVALSIIFFCLATVFVALRFYARYKQKAKLLDDDWLMVVSLIFLAVNTGIVVTIVVVGHLGLHSGALNLDQAILLGKGVVIAEAFYITNVNLVKLSLLSMYYRIFPVKSMAIGCYILGAISMAWNIGLFGVIATQCIPFEKNWLPWVAGKCVDLRTLYLAVSIPNIATDVAILTLPMPQVWKLHTDSKQKIALSIIFLLGSLVVFASVFRFVIYLKFHPEDTPYTLAFGAALNIVEISAGIVSACMPTLGPVVRGCLGRTTIFSKQSNNKEVVENPDLVTIGGGGGNHRNHKKNFISRQKRSLYRIDDDDTKVTTSTVDLVGEKEDVSWQETQYDDDNNHIIEVETIVTQESERESAVLEKGIWLEVVCRAQREEKRRQTWDGSMV